MQLFESGKEYWTIALRYHTHRDNPVIEPVAVRDMQRLLETVTCEGVRRRIGAFIANHSKQPGPSLA